MGGCTTILTLAAKKNSRAPVRMEMVNTVGADTFLVPIMILKEAHNGSSRGGKGGISQ